MEKPIKNPPLQEVVFEIKWNVTKIPTDVFVRDSKIVAGIIFDKIKDKYPYYEPLDASKIPLPDEAISGIVQYRFRNGKDKFPLIQIGAGVFTINENNEENKYNWEDFKNRCIEDIKIFLDTHNISQAIESITLKYVNTIKFNFEKDNVFEFLKNKMGVVFQLPETFLDGSNLENNPLNFNIAFANQCKKPDGILKIFFASGKSSGEDVIVLNLEFSSKKIDIPEPLIDNLGEWLENSHLDIETAFLNLVKKIDDAQ